VSVSLNEDIIESLDKLKSLGFSGRSEIIRAGIRNLLSDERMKEDLDGEINSLLLAVHDEDSDDQVSSIRHDFDKIIIVHLHNKIDKDRCLEIFSLKGDAKDVKEISRQLQVNKRMHFVKLIVVSPLSTHCFINCDVEIIFYLTSMKVKNHGRVFISNNF
jgi:CopG family nickel-responsive transcriptional regulator